MDNKNRAQNRLAYRREQTGGAESRSSAELLKFSVAKQVRVERAAAEPDYSRWMRQVRGHPPQDPDPNDKGPQAEDLWNLQGYWGLHGYLLFESGNYATVELWVRDPVRHLFFFVEDKKKVLEKREFHFDGQVRGREIFLRITAPDPDLARVDIIACPE